MSLAICFTALRSGASATRIGVVGRGVLAFSEQEMVKATTKIDEKKKKRPPPLRRDHSRQRSGYFLSFADPHKVRAANWQVARQFDFADS